MGQGMDGMNESWEPEDVEESQQRRVNTLLPEPQRLRIEADGLFKRAKKAEEKNKAITTERDQLRAEVDRLKKVVEYESGFRKLADDETARAEASEKDAADCRAEYRDLFAKAGAMSDKLIAAESTAAGLRRAMEDAKSFVGQTVASEESMALNSRLATALAASPDEHERRSLDSLKAKVLRRAAEGLQTMAETVEKSRTTPCTWEACVNRLLEIADQLDRQAEADRLEAANGR